MGSSSCELNISICTSSVDSEDICAISPKKYAFIDSDRTLPEIANTFIDDKFHFQLYYGQQVYSLNAYLRRPSPTAFSSFFSSEAHSFGHYHERLCSKGGTLSIALA